MPFGLNNAIVTYQRAMNLIFHYFIVNIVEVVYIDDVVVNSLFIRVICLISRQCLSARTRLEDEPVKMCIWRNSRKLPKVLSAQQRGWNWQEEIGPEVEECLSHRWTAKKAGGLWLFHLYVRVLLRHEIVRWRRNLLVAEDQREEHLGWIRYSWGMRSPIRSLRLLGLCMLR